MVDSMPVSKLQLHVPSLQEVTEVLHDGLSKNFSDVQVSVVDCPDLTQKPFMFAEKGLCGSPRLADIGGVPNLIPLVKREKRYDFDEVARLCELPEGFLMGAGAGPAYFVGVNSELMPNLKAGAGGKNCTHCCKMNVETGEYELSQLDHRGFMVLMNLFISEGKPGRVLEVRARQRTGPENYMSCIRKTLASHYGTKPVGLGGTFLIEKGKAKIHVMPDFSEKPLNSDDEVDEWLKFFEMSSPLLCAGYLVSHDPGDQYDLRMEHFHVFSDHGDGGHYHYDTTPNDVSYIGYFNIGEMLYRVDQPNETHNIGRD